MAALIVKNPDWLAYLGFAYAKRGKHKSAISAFKKALVRSEELVDSSMRTKRQAYQFWLERARYNSGQPCAKDPLILCNFKPVKKADSSQGNQSAGYFELRFIQSGLWIKVQLGNRMADLDFVDLMIDGIPFRRIKVRNKAKRILYVVKRPALTYFPVQGELSVRASNGLPLFMEGKKGTGALLEIPHGNGEIKNILKEIVYLDKKGDIPLSKEEIKQRHEEYLRLYAKVKAFFDKEIDKPLFILYGTLLGVYRDGELIPGDDDFDVGYLSEKNDPVAVKEEAKEIIEKLVRAGFTISFNQAGRPLRIRDSNNSVDLHLDVRPVWYQGGKIWAHLQACLPLKMEDFKPIQKTNFRGIEVYIPQRPDKFLEAYYGSGWKVPDPSYSNYNKQVDPVVKKNLAKACLTISEFRNMKEIIFNKSLDRSKMGELIFKPDYDLYPLEEYEAKVGWN